jgi:hypothetical protein
MSTKTCTKCAKVLNLTSFNMKSGTSRLNTQCIDCCKAACKAHYNKNKAHYFERNKKYKSSIKKFLEESKSVPCFDCGKSYSSYVMDFDHMRDKTFNIANASTIGYSLERIKEEINKCQIVCSNCHRMRTHNEGHKKDNGWAGGI